MPKSQWRPSGRQSKGSPAPAMIAAISAAPSVIIVQVATRTPTERPAKRAMMSETPQASAQPAPQAAALSSIRAPSRRHAIMQERPGEGGLVAGSASAMRGASMAARIMGGGAGAVEVHPAPPRHISVAFARDDCFDSRGG